MARALLFSNSGFFGGLRSGPYHHEDDSKPSIPVFYHISTPDYVVVAIHCGALCAELVECERNFVDISRNRGFPERVEPLRAPEEVERNSFAFASHRLSNECRSSPDMDDRNLESARPQIGGTSARDMLDFSSGSSGKR